MSALVLAFIASWACTKPNPAWVGLIDDLDSGKDDSGISDGGLEDVGWVEDTGSDQDTGTDVGERPDSDVIVGFRLDAPAEIAEDEEFLMKVIPINPYGEDIGGFRGDVTITGNWGNVGCFDEPSNGVVGRVAPASLRIESKTAEGASLYCTLNRAGAVSVVVTNVGRDPGVAEITVVPRAWEAVYTVPVFSVGAAGSWDAASVRHPSILAEPGDQFRMFYAGSGGNGKYRIGVSALTDSLNRWERNSNDKPALDVSDEDDSFLRPMVVKDVSGYHMWHTRERADGYTYISTAYAHLSGNLAFVTRVNEEGKLEPFNEGANPETSVYSPFMLRESGQSKLWYVTMGNSGVANISFATTYSFPWTWQVSNSNPVLVPDIGRWEMSGLDTPAVIKVGSVYRMWYVSKVAEPGKPVRDAIGYATSVDGVEWTKVGNGPVFTTGHGGGGFDAIGVADPFVISVDGKLIMFYAGYNGSKWEIGMAQQVVD